MTPGVTHVVCNVSTMLALNYLGTAFTMLSFERGYNFLRATHFYMFIMIFVALVLWKTLGITKMAQKIDK